MINYSEDKYGVECLNLAHNCKSDMRFGAVLVLDDEIIGRGWNRLSTAEERSILTHVDYATHAEQGAIIDALQKGKDISGGKIYVLGYAKKSRELSTRNGKFFTCRKCPHSMIRFNLSVFIPHPIAGWQQLSGEEALDSAKEHKGYWKNFCK